MAQSPKLCAGPDELRACWADRVAQASPPAGSGSVPLPVLDLATSRGGTPLEPAAGTAALHRYAPEAREILDHLTGNHDSRQRTARIGVSISWPRWERQYARDGEQSFTLSASTRERFPRTDSRFVPLNLLRLTEARSGARVCDPLQRRFMGFRLRPSHLYIA